MLSVILGAALLGLIWWPPLLQQRGSSHGNLTAIVDFYAHHRNPLTRNGLLTTFDYLAKASGGSGVARSAGLATVPFAHAVTALTMVITVLVAIALAAPRRPRYLRFLTVVVAVGLLASAFAGNDIVGPTFGYLLEWTLGVVAALVFAAAGAVGVLLSRYWEGLPVPGGRTVLAIGSVVGCMAVAVILGVQAATYPKLSSVSYSAIGRAANQALVALRPGDLPTQINLHANSLTAIDMYSGLCRRPVAPGRRPGHRTDLVQLLRQWMVRTPRTPADRAFSKRHHRLDLESQRAAVGRPAAHRYLSTCCRHA